ncbi:ComEC/Rec2 family competence protein [Mucilaginibacter sp. AW1-3]
MNHHELKINILKAFNGDAIRLSFKDVQDKIWNILIDGGPSAAYKKKGKKHKTEFGALFDLIKKIKDSGQLIDLLILTHIDDDHIDGLLKWIENEPLAYKMIGQIWFNSGKLIAEYLEQGENDALKLPLHIRSSFETSVSQALDFEEYIATNKIYERKVIIAGTKCTFGDLAFQFLSPKKKQLEDLLKLYKAEASSNYFNTSGGRGDYSKSIKEHIKDDVFVSDNRVANGSSIAFILSHKGKDYLFLGDSHPGPIVEQLSLLDKPLTVEFVKISHHGSAGNTSPELLKLIDTEKYVISTHGLQHGHPDKVLIARIIAKNPKATIAFNYPELITFIFSDQDHQDFPDFKTGDANRILNSNG